MVMSLAGVASFQDMPSFGKRRFFTSTLLLGAELCYKLAFFWGMSIIACKACCDFDWAVYGYSLASSTAAGIEGSTSSTWTTLLAVYSSPAILRGSLFRAFSVVHQLTVYSLLLVLPDCVPSGALSQD
jgi:hypothetical protein